MAGFRFAFALTSALGNQTRNENVHKFAAQDPEVELTWAPISHYDESVKQVWPGPIHRQIVLNRQAASVLSQWRQLDAVVVHAFQLYCSLVVRRRLRGGPLLVLAQDYAPLRDPAMIAGYGRDATPTARRRARRALETWFTRRADLCVPWSTWVAESLVHDCGVPSDRVEVLHPGVDLGLWTPSPPATGDVVRALFVGGDWERKGGPQALQVCREMSGCVELDVVSRSAPQPDGPGVRVHRDLTANDPRLRSLYERCDFLILPTRADMSSFAVIEAMATGRPVVTTSVGGIPDLVDHGDTGFLVPPDDIDSLRDATTQLVSDAALRRRMGEAARRKAERELSAETNTERLLERLKQAVRERRRSRS